jgi:hypothetical protein
LYYALGAFYTFILFLKKDGRCSAFSLNRGSKHSSYTRSAKADSKNKKERQNKNKKSTQHPEAK